MCHRWQQDSSCGLPSYLLGISTRGLERRKNNSRHVAYLRAGVIHDVFAHVSHIVGKSELAARPAVKRRKRRDAGCSAAAVPWKSVWPGEPAAHLPPCCSLAPGAFSRIVIRGAFGSAMCRDRPKQPARLMYGQNKSSCSRNKDVSPCVSGQLIPLGAFFLGGGVGGWEGFHI